MHEFANQWPLITTMAFMFFGFIGMLGAFITHISATRSELQAMGQRIDGVHKEIMELIKKMK